jgi:hypothetical protein
MPSRCGLPGGYLLVGFVDILDRENSQVTVIAEVTQSQAGTRLDAQLIDGLLRHIKADGHAKQVAVRQTNVLDHSVTQSIEELPTVSGHLRELLPIIIGLIHET